LRDGPRPRDEDASGTGTPASLRAAAALIPPQCYVNPAWRGLAFLARDLALYVAAVAVLLWTDTPALLVAAWLAAAAALCGLFVIGHDAAHGALFRSPALCAVVAQLAFLPTLHAVAVWALGHNRVHHSHTGCLEIDFVWRPLSPTEYACLSRARRWRHRFEWSAWGAGAYYLRAIWWHRMVGAAPPPRLRAAFRRDRRIVGSYAVVASAVLLAFGYGAAGSIVDALWIWGKVFVVPWLLFSQVIGAVVYVQHIGADIPWWPRQRWHNLAGQVEGTVSYEIPRWLNAFWHNILLHVAHHVDPRVPFYHLPAATLALAREYPDLAEQRRLGWREYWRTTRTCKLYDVDRAIWVDYAGRPVSRTREAAR
jgi:omega-6 fatty acid desaturase (delta-12 desaturase)